jgi:hypothetical protein
VNFECNTGNINTTHYEPEIGIIAKGSDQYGFCMTSAKGYVDKCSDIYDTASLKRDIIEQCDGRENCTIYNPSKYFSANASFSPYYENCNSP